LGTTPFAIEGIGYGTSVLVMAYRGVKAANPMETTQMLAYLEHNLKRQREGKKVV